ncbi:MAG: hypothetical protein JSW51_10480 [Gemmatimonadota bacterium]|nr:MAG: hypothetical protein JSW51_10480 [Gemmatimonadota bacterium]
MTRPKKDRSETETAVWPKLPHTKWTDTIETVHMWSQIVGKIRMELSPWVNHSWSVPLYVTPRGLTTSSIPYGRGAFQIDFDLIGHALPIVTSDGQVKTIALGSKTVADFYAEVLAALDEMGIEVSINPIPNELPDPIAFHKDQVHGTYEREHITALHGALVHSARVMNEFRAAFIGKVSPVHFFWGSFDLAVTRFSGRTAPPHPGGMPNLPDVVAREAYSHEVSSCGFWLGNREAPDPIFYAYAYPTPDGFSDAPVRPKDAFWLGDLGEFVLPYDAVRRSGSPDEDLFAFCQTTYEAAADLAKWDRKSLEWERGYRPLPRGS